MLWRAFAAPPAPDIAPRVWRLQIAATFGWTLDQVDALAVDDVADCLAWCAVMGSDRQPDAASDA